MNTVRYSRHPSAGPRAPERTRAPLHAADGWARRRGRPARSGMLGAAWLLALVATLAPAAAIAAATGSQPTAAAHWRLQVAQLREAGHGAGAAAALVVECRGGMPVMLGVLHVRGGRLVLSLPGGSADPGEKPAATAVRETLEETGYLVRAKRSLGSPPMAAPGFSVVLAEVAERRSPGPRPGEVVAAVWVDPRRVPESAWRFAGDRQWVIPLFERHAPEDCA